MKRNFFCLLLLFTSFITASKTHAQIPPPIDLGIQNIPQETDVWCWVAVAQQIILASRGPQGTPQQCSLVAIASNTPAAYCCQTPTPCRRVGHLTEIQNLILHFGGRYSQILLPTDPMSVYQTLASRRAIIMEVMSSPYSSHVVVIRGMAWAPTPMGIQPVLYINDPLGFFVQPILFSNLLPYWRTAIVVN